MKFKNSQLFGLLAFCLWLPLPALYLDPPDFLAGQPLAIYAVALFFGGLAFASTALWMSFRRRVSELTARIYVFLFVLAFVGAYQFSGLAPSWQCFGKKLEAAVGRAAGQNCTTTCTNNDKKPCGGWSSCWDKFVSCNSSGRDQDGRDCQGCCFSCTVVCEDPDPDPEPTYQPPTIGVAVDCSKTGNNGWCVGEAVLTLTASDPQNFSVTITGDIGGTTFACTAGAKTCTKDLAEGSGTINYKVTASTSNLTATGSTTWKEDRTYPVANLIIPSPTGSGGWFKTAPVVVSVNGSDAGSGVAVAEMSLDAGVTWQASDLSLSADGTYVVHYGLTDLAGNRTDYSGQMIQIDAVPPAMSLSTVGTLGNMNWYVTDVQTTITATDETSGIDRVEYDLDGTGWQSGTVIPNHEGVNTISIRAFDVAGNVSSASVQNNVDTTPPSLTPILPQPDGSNGWYVTGPATVSADGFDGGSGLVQVVVSVNQGPWQDNASLSDGTYTVDFKSIDIAGNVITASRIVKVDTLGPVLSTSTSGTRGNAGWYLDQTVTTISARDETSGVDRIQFQKNDDEWQDGGTVVSTDGVNDISVRAYDSAGNISNDSVLVKVDSVKPMSKFVTPLNGSTHTVVRGQFTFSGSAVDMTSGIESAEISFDGKSWHPVVREADSLWHYDWDTSSLPDGVYPAVVRATDIAGNREVVDSAAQATLLVNNSPPRIKLTPEWLIWESATLSINTEYFPVKEGVVVIADAQGRWPSVQIPFGAKYPSEITWDRRFGNGILAPSGEYFVAVSACNIFDLCSEKSAVIKIPWYAVALPISTVPTELVEVAQEPEKEIRGPMATAMPPIVQPSAVGPEQAVEQPGPPMISLLPVVVLIALLWATSSSALVDKRPTAIHGIAKTITMQNYIGEWKNE